MHAFSIFAWAIFVAGYITARWDLVTRLYELAIFAWEYGVVASSSRITCPFSFRHFVGTCLTGRYLSRLGQLGDS